jgi:hypothetical protein
VSAVPAAELEPSESAARPLSPESSQRLAILAAGFAPLLVSLQLFAALLFPLAGAGPSWSRDAPFLIACELVLVHAGVLMSGFAGTNGAFRFIGLSILTIVYGSFVYAFVQIGQSWWIGANLGVLLLVRLYSALHDGAKSAGERVARGFLTMIVFLALILFPVIMAKKFPAFGFTTGVFAQLKPGLETFSGMVDNGPDLAKAVVLAGLLYLLSAWMDLVRLRMVYRETSAPGISVADGSLALRGDSHELTAAHVGNSTGAFVWLTFGVLACSPTYVGIATGKAGDAIFGLLFLWPGWWMLRNGLRELLSRTVFHARKGEIVLRETPLLGEERVRHVRENLAAALSIVDGYYDKNKAKPEFFNVVLQAGGEDVEVATYLPSRSQAEGLRKVLLAYTQGIERPEVKQTLRDDYDVRNLLGGHAEAALRSS